MLCCEQEKMLSDLGIGWSSNSFIFLLDNWHYVHEVWILFLLKYWRSIHKEIVEVLWIYLFLIFEDKF